MGDKVFRILYGQKVVISLLGAGHVCKRDTLIKAISPSSVVLNKQNKYSTL